MPAGAEPVEPDCGNVPKTKMNMRLMTMVLYAGLVLSSHGGDETQLVHLRFINLPKSLAQGVHVLRFVVDIDPAAKSAVKLDWDRTGHSVEVDAAPATQPSQFKEIPNSQPVGILSMTSTLLEPGEKTELSGSFAVNVPPGHYMLQARLSGRVAVESEPVEIEIAPGQIVHPHK